MHSNIIGYQWPIEGTKQVAYVTMDDHIHEMVGQQNNRWRDTDPTRDSGAPSVPTESVLMTGYAWPDGHTKQIDYVLPVDGGGDGHIHELVMREGSPWSYEDLMNQPAGAPASDGTTIAGYAWKANGTKQVVYTSADGHIHELSVGVVGTRKHTSPTQQTNAPLLEGAGLTAYVWEAGSTKQIAYISGDGHVQELAAGKDGIWRHTDLTQVTGAPLADEGSPIVGYAWEEGRTKQVVYLGNEGRVYELVAGVDGTWRYVDLLEETSAPVAAGLALTGFAWETGFMKQVVYVSDEGHVQELAAGTDGKWNYTDLTHLTGAPAASRDTIAGYEWTSQFAKEILFLDTGETPRIHELMLEHGSSWRHQDLTTLTGARDIV